VYCFGQSCSRVMVCTGCCMMVASLVITRRWVVTNRVIMAVVRPWTWCVFAYVLLCFPWWPIEAAMLCDHERLE
jgi:hypothetical protein